MLEWFRSHPAKHYTVDPGRAEEMVINLLRRRQKFALTQEAEYGSMYDVVNITLGDRLVEKGDVYEYAKSLVCETLDDAIQFALNCVRNKLSFSCFVTQNVGHHEQWSFTAERHRSIRERRGSRVFA